MQRREEGREDRGESEAKEVLTSFEEEEMGRPSMGLTVHWGGKGVWRRVGTH